MSSLCEECFSDFKIHIARAFFLSPVPTLVRAHPSRPSHPQGHDRDASSHPFVSVIVHRFHIASISIICHHIILYYTFALFTVLHRFGGTFISFTLPDWHPMLRRPEDEINDKRSDNHPFLEAAFVSLSVITWRRVFFPCFSTIATSSHFPGCVGLQNGVFGLICRGQTTLQHGMELSVGRRAKPCDPH